MAHAVSVGAIQWGEKCNLQAHAGLPNTEECQRAMLALGLLLQCYLTAYQELGERERFVLQMVEIRGMRYAELAQVLGIRPEALKMGGRARRHLPSILQAPCQCISRSSAVRPKRRRMAMEAVEVEGVAG